MQRLKLWAKTFVLGFFFGAIAVAQVTTGTISGKVSDFTGAVLPGVTVSLKSVEKGISRTVSTDEGGRYRVPELALGSYEVTAEAAGFQTVIRSGITLTVSREAVVDFTLQVGAIAERITVTGEAPLIHEGGDRRIGRLDQRRFARHGDSLRDGADLKSEIHHGLPTHGQGDAAPDHCLETGGLCRDLVAAQCQFWNPVAPALIGTHGSADSFLDAFQAHGAPG